MEKVLKEENLRRHSLRIWERSGPKKTMPCTKGRPIVKWEKSLLRARSLLSSGGHLVGLQFPLVEIRHRVDDDLWDATSEINDLGTQKIVSAIPCT
jgi:hypothetical protein